MTHKKEQKRTFRLVLVDQDTFAAVRSFGYRTWYPWMALGMVLGIVILLVGLILSIKPVQVLLARTKKIESEELLLLRAKTLELENLANQQNLMIYKLQHLVSGEAIQDSSAVDLSLITSDSILPMEPIAEEFLIRDEVDREDRLNLEATQAVSNTRNQNLPLAQLYLVPPISGGSVSLAFDPIRQHYGVDINAAASTPVKSVLSGHIIYAGWTLETGNTIGIQHDNNLISFYKHNSALLKEQGTFVEAGEAVAIIGNSGTLSSGPHLHFELWSQGKPVDPQDFIDF